MPINILEGFGDAAKKYQYQGGRPSWINIVGTGKIGKTRFLVEMMDHLRTAYIDVDPFQGTKPYTGTFFVIDNYKALSDRIDWFEMNKEVLKLDMIVLDNLDGAYELIAAHVAKEYGVKDIYDLKIPGIGNGFSVAYDLYYNLISRLKTLAPLLVSICHIKSARKGVSEIVNQVVYEMNLPAGLQVWTQKATDTNLWFSLTMDDQHEGPYVRITQDPTDPYASFNGGSRNFPGLFDLKDEFALKEYLITNFKQGE